MDETAAEAVTIAVGDRHTVSGLLLAPKAAAACFVFAHGAGAGMSHAFMEDVAAGLAALGIATLRFQFPYMESGNIRPDPPIIAHATIKAATKKAATLLPGCPLFAGGKSFGGRMTSQAQAAAPLPDVRGLVFLGFPLHPSKRPSDERAEHLFKVRIPMLFLQGTRDPMAELQWLEPVVERLGERATMHLFQDADHSFHVPARSGRTDADVRQKMLDTLADWMRAVPPVRPDG
jgi:uncharacterized protein